MPLESRSTLQQTDEVTAVAPSSTGGGGGGGGGTTLPDGLFARDGDTDNFPETILPTYDTSGPSAAGPKFIGAGEDVEWRRDPGNDIALEVRDTTNGNRLLWLDDNGRLHTRRDQEAFADGGGSTADGVNSLLQVEDAGTVLTTDAASIGFTGSGVSVSQNGDDITVDISGGSGSDIDIEQNQSVVVGGATGLSFEGSGIDGVTNDGDGTATVSISKGSSTEVQEGGTTQVTNVTVLDFVSGDFSVANPTGGEAEVSLENDTVTVAGNIVPLGGSTDIAHGDLSNIGSDDHHTRYSDSEAISAINNDADHGSTASHNYTSSASGLSDVSPDSVAGAHHAVFEPADYNPVSDVESHGNALAIDITGDADKVDGYDGGELAALSENETITGNWNIDFRNAQLKFSADNHNWRWVAADFWNGNGNDRLLLWDDDNNREVLTADISGNVGLSGVPAPSYAVEAGGDMRATGEVEAFLGSDRRLKTSLDPLDSALDKVGALTGYAFDWRGADEVQPHKRGETDVGLIAQDVEEVLPEAVKTLSDGHSEGYKAVQYDKVVPLLVEAIKDLRSQVNNLQ